MLRFPSGLEGSSFLVSCLWGSGLLGGLLDLECLLKSYVS